MFMLLPERNVTFEITAKQGATLRVTEDKIPDTVRILLASGAKFVEIGERIDSPDQEVTP